MPTKLAENLKEIHAENIGRKYVADWKERLPEGSKWFPGSNGKPDCKECHGLGWLRVDLPTGHPMFGKLFPCICVNKTVREAILREMNLTNRERGGESLVPYPD